LHTEPYDQSSEAAAVQKQNILCRYACCLPYGPSKAPANQYAEDMAVGHEHSFVIYPDTRVVNRWVFISYRIVIVNRRGDARKRDTRKLLNAPCIIVAPFESS
jgi:hypothetical protein